MAISQDLLPSCHLLALLLDECFEVANFAHLVLVDRLEELDRLLHSEEHVALLSHVQGVVVRELLDHEHLGFKVLDTSLDDDVHNNGQVLVRRQVQLTGLDGDSTPKIHHILINFLADISD